ncbi:hypothetical protein [Streptomyces sp. cmx-4-9]|uniref:hypothetical protein n=1 Tax=Streptomyces sp. cmx-4-9 TaxID=2790941 RepID=UPI00397EA226
MNPSALHHDLHRAAAQAALAVPGVAALQPSFAERLALAASRTGHAAAGTNTSRPVETAGVRCTPAADGTWCIEVRCVLHADRRIADTAQRVREHVRTAATTCLDRHGTTGSVAVQVTVTRAVGGCPPGPNRLAGLGPPRPSEGTSGA